MLRMLAQGFPFWGNQLDRVAYPTIVSGVPVFLGMMADKPLLFTNLFLHEGNLLLIGAQRETRRTGRVSLG